MEEPLSANLHLQKAKIQLSCSACVGQMKDDMHGVISGVIEVASSPLGNQLIAGGAGKELA